MTRNSYFAIAVTLLIIGLAVANHVGALVNITSGSGMEFVSNDLSLRRDCSDAQFLGWANATVVWNCSNTLEGPDINGGTWHGTIDSASTATSTVTFNDDVPAAFGTGGDSTISFDGTDTSWDLRNVGSGDLMLALAGSFPSPDPDVVHIWKGSAGSVASLIGSAIVLEDNGVVYLQILTPNTVSPALLFGDAENNIAGAVVYDHVNNELESVINGTTRLKQSQNTLAFQQATTISTTAGGLTLSGSAGTVASSAPFVIQNVSQTTTPGTTINGHIRLWEDSDAGGVEGRILAQINGTTFQWNADAGLTFENQALTFQQDKDRFAAGKAQWESDRTAELDDEYEDFRTSQPGLILPPSVPAWTPAYINFLAAQYKRARASLGPLAEIPTVGTFAELQAENPWPDPATYTIADPTSDETITYRNGTQITQGTPVVLVADRVDVDQASGENLSIHTVPSSLVDEFLWLLDNDQAFLSAVKVKLEIP